MNSKIRIALLVAAAGCAAPAFAQDSVSINTNGGNGMPGDAVKYWETANQRTSYVVDLSRITTSWGTHFRVGPIMKANKTQDATDTFFGMLWSANSISPTMISAPSYPSSSYRVWNTTGAGINATENNGDATAVNPVGASTQFAVAGYQNSTEHANPAAAADSRRASVVSTAVCNFDPSDPYRVYVTRVTSAQNVNPFNATLSAVENAERCVFGYGSVDAAGNTYVRSDNNGTQATITNRMNGQNIFRFKALSRNAGVINSISNLGGTDASATDRIVNQYTLNTFGCPTSCIPADLAGVPSGRYAGLKFDNTTTDLNNYAYEGAANTATLVNTRTNPTDTRGGSTFSALQIFPSSVGTTAFLLRDAGSGAESAYSIQVYPTNANGSLTGAPTNNAFYNLRRPAVDTLTDHSDGYVWPENGTLSNFRGYQGISAFSGAVQVGLGKDSSGRGLVAAVVYNSQGDSLAAGDPMNALVVGRFNPTNPTGTVTWALAGYNESILANRPANIGKSILSGPGGTAIGRMCTLAEVTNFNVPFGPSISSPTFDSKGNLWFLTAAELFNRRGQGVSDFDTVLVRGVYNEATFSYDLELVMEQGTIVAGANSGLNYQVQFLELAYVGTGTAANGGISPGTLQANSALPAAWNNSDPALYSQTDSRTLGGMVLQAKVVYDIGTSQGVDGPDGYFDDPTGSNPTYPNSRDEAYRVLLYITGEACRADFNMDGSVDFFDYLDFVDAFSTNAANSDFNHDGSIDFFDYLDFVDAFSIGC